MSRPHRANRRERLATSQFLADYFRSPARSPKNPQKQADSSGRDAVSVTSSITPTNDASRTLQHGSNRKTGVLVQDDDGPRSLQAELLAPADKVGFEPTTSGLECSLELRSRTSRPAGNRTHLLPLAIIAASLFFASGNCLAQAAGAIGDGLIERIERRADRLEARLESSTREQGRIADFFERLSNREGNGILDRGEGMFSRFLDRIGNGLLLICGTLVLVVTPIGVAMLIREVRRKA